VDSDDSDGPELRRSGPGLFKRILLKLGIGRGEHRHFEGPVSWLLGSQMLGSIKGILLYSAYGKKLDPRDWMTARLFSFDPADRTRPLKTRRGHPVELEATVLDPPDPDGPTRDEKGGFWFDYISDTGDGMRATYSIAYLCLSDLRIGSLQAEGLKAGLGLEKLKAGQLKEALSGKRPAAEPEYLPRGEFLFVGGDTAYHASDYMTLVNRFWTTFNWAYNDALAHDRVRASDAPRPIFGIPGNHDYYDQLDGFRRQFRNPAQWEPEPPTPASEAPFEDPASEAPVEATRADPKKDAQLILRGFYRVQEASYVALKLPYDWMMWGLDTEVGQIDRRQTDFFRQFCDWVGRGSKDAPRPEQVEPPDKLIVATCSPTTAFGKLADPKDYKSADAFGQIGIRQPFLPENLDRAADRGIDLKVPYDLSETGDARLLEGQCRLDISGDVHHYARYWGPRAPAGSVPPRHGDGRGAQAQQPDAQSYASVVSGIGGAFHHPSQTYVDEVREQVLYPSERFSTEEVSRRVFKFWEIATGGSVWLAGAVVAFLIYFAFTVPQSSREFLNSFVPERLGLTQPEQITPTVIVRKSEPYDPPTPRQAAESTATSAPASAPAPTPDASKVTLPAEQWAVDTNAKKEVTPWLWRKLGGAGWWTIPPVGRPGAKGCLPDSPRYLFGPCDVKAPWYFWAGVVALLVASVPLFVLALWADLYEKSPKTRRKERLKEQEAKRKKKERERRRKASAHGPTTASYSAPAGGDEVGASERAETPRGQEIKRRPKEEEIGQPDFWLGVLCAVAAALLLFGAFTVTPFWEHITPFANSLLVLLVVVWGGAAVALAVRYSEFLFNKQQRHTQTTGFFKETLEGATPWLLSVAGVVAAGYGLWAFGQNNPAVLIITDALFVAVVLGLGVGLVWALPFKVGAELLSTKRKSVRVAGKILIGFFHYVLQLAVPFVLVRKASWLTLLVAAAVIAAGTPLGGWLLGGKHRGWLARHNRMLLVLAWVVLGAAVLLVPLLCVHTPGSDAGGTVSPLVAPWFVTAGPTYEWTGWWGLVLSAVAAVVGAVMCCYWFGWYLGVCFAYNGHNNEVGGAARIEQFKQFIRFRLTEDSLTGYVIAVNDPEEDGDKLIPHLVDVFRLEPARPGKAGGPA
jgi:hypothetical protein